MLMIQNHPLEGVQDGSNEA